MKKQIDALIKKIADSGELTAIEKRTVLNSLKKRIPYKPKEYEDKYYACHCGNVVLWKWEDYPVVLTPKSEGLPFCMACGQKIDWSEEDETNGKVDCCG